jgi:hypothetical protein
VDVIGGVVFALIGAYVGTRFVERIEISKTDSPKETIAF